MDAETARKRFNLATYHKQCCQR